MSQLRGCYFLTLINGTIINSLLLFYLELRLVCTKIHRFVQYTPVKGFKNFLQSTLSARRQVDDNTTTSVVAQAMQLLANSSYPYQFMDRSRHSCTNFTIVEKTHAAINKKLLKRLGCINDQLYEVELAKSEIEHKEQIFVGFFDLQYAKLRMLELHDKLSPKFATLTSMRR